MQVILAIFTIV